MNVCVCVSSFPRYPPLRGVWQFLYQRRSAEESTQGNFRSLREAYGADVQTDVHSCPFTSNCLSAKSLITLEVRVAAMPVMGTNPYKRHHFSSIKTVCCGWAHDQAKIFSVQFAFLNIARTKSPPLGRFGFSEDIKSAWCGLVMVLTSDRPRPAPSVVRLFSRR